MSYLKIGKVDSLSGIVAASPSKSYTHRAVIVAGMNGISTIKNPLLCDDTKQTIKLWRQLGAAIDCTELHETFLAVKGFNGTPSPSQGLPFDVGESGTLLRFLLSQLALGQGKYTVVGRGSLLTRPNTELISVLKGIGVKIHGTGLDATLPIEVEAVGALAGGEAVIEGRMSSQVVSSLLIAAPCTDRGIDLRITESLVSKPYVDITKNVLEWAGVDVKISENYTRFQVAPSSISPSKEIFRVPGDFSSAAFILAAAVLSNSDVTVEDLDMDDPQGDKEIVYILERMGAHIEVDKISKSIRVRGPHKLRGVEIDIANISDLAPILTVLGCFAEGTTRIYNGHHLKLKESNRILHPAKELREYFGAKVVGDVDKGEIIVHKSDLQLKKSGKIDPQNDHRIAMSLAVAAMHVSDDVLIDNEECIHKSYPSFFGQMKYIKAPIDRNEGHFETQRDLVSV